MFECQICGLLHLGGSACPACGSQLRNDLASDTDSDEVLPTDVPGLDDAAAAWYDLEGIEPPPEAPEPVEEAPAEVKGSLPFGFQGESNVYDSRLPFGIGSFAEGIPFESASDATPVVHVEPAPSPVDATTTSPVEMDAVETTPPAVDEVPPPPSLPDSVETENEDHDSIVDLGGDSDATDAPPPPPGPMPATPPSPPSSGFGNPPPPPGPMPATPPPPPTDQGGSTNDPVRLTTARLVVAAPVQDEPPVPDYWRIDAQIPNYEEIYGQEAAVVEMEYASLEDDVVVYDHTTDSPAAVFHSPLEATPQSTTTRSVKLRLHPAQALAVDVGNSPDLQHAMSEGFSAMQRADWSAAARAFQRMAATMPTSAEVFNNYGISLLQRAMAMRDGGDPQQASVAETQFESSILALREAAKSAPTNADVLVNLGIALIESGRAEKALGIMNVHNARTPGSAKGLNTAGVAMFHLGQLTQAVETFRTAGDDTYASENLALLSPS